jgi:acyl-CoA reductase-like NAD-dependent aldehyde dehydrogenase
VTTPEEIRSLATTLRRAPFDAERMRRALVATARRLARPDDAASLRLRHAAALTSGLSAAMVDFAIETSANVVTDEALAELHTRTCGTTPVALAGVVLAGNVTTAAIRALAVPLALGAAVIVKASSRDDVVARGFAELLTEVDAACGARLVVVAYEGGDAALDAALVRVCDTVHVYGSDETIDAFTKLAPDALHAHGHGLGLGLVAPDAALATAADAFALDVAAYDQRGCLSPHAIYVLGDTSRADELSRRLATALDAVALRLPRGPLDASALAAQSVARALAAMEGDVFEGASATVVHTRVFRGSPLNRFVRVIGVPDTAAFVDATRDVARYVTCIGVAGDLGSAPALSRAAIVPAGTMQLPALAADADGRPCFEGFVHDEEPIR